MSDLLALQILKARRPVKGELQLVQKHHPTIVILPPFHMGPDNDRWATLVASCTENLGKDGHAVSKLHGNITLENSIARQDLSTFVTNCPCFDT